ADGHRQDEGESTESLSEEWPASKRRRDRTAETLSSRKASSRKASSHEAMDSDAAMDSAAAKSHPHALRRSRRTGREDCERETQDERESLHGHASLPRG